MVKKNLLRSLSVVMACMMAVMTVACGSNTVENKEAVATEAAAETKEEKSLETALLTGASTVGSSEEAGKVETVYVTANASGAVDNVIVSEWLKNANASSELADTSELKDIVNVKGKESFTQNSDGTLTWNADGSDIYYQGTTDKELPVDMKITYTLDGKEISPEELAGKSGKVTIRFEYDNKEKKTVDVDGKEIEVYTPFALVSGMMLDTDKFTNVEISNGKVISDGGNYIVMGVALPGLKESLDISDEKWEELESDEDLDTKLSNYFEVTADTSDFELGMTITMASSDILSDFGFSDLTDSGKIEDLKDDMGQLNDGSTKLVDGTKELKDGTTKLRDGSKELYDGTGKLYDGTKELKDGTQKLYDGTNELNDGAGKLASGTGELANGANTLHDGTGKLSSGTQSLADGAGKLYDGSKSLYDGVVSYTDGAAKVNAGAGQLSQGTKELKAGSEKLSNGAGQLKAGADALATGASQLSAGVTQLSSMTGAVQELLTTKSQLEAAKAFLTTPGTSCSEALLPLLSQLSNGNIDSVEKANEVKAAGLAALASQTSQTVVTEPAGSDMDAIDADFGELTNPDEDENTDDVKESTPAPVEQNTDINNDTTEPVQENETVKTEDTVTLNVDNVDDNEDDDNLAAMLGESKVGATGDGNDSVNLDDTDEKKYTEEDFQNAVNAAVAEKLQAAVEAELNSLLNSPDKLMATLSSKPEVLQQLLTSEQGQNMILGNEELLAKVMSNETLQNKLLSSPEVKAKIMSSPEIQEKLKQATYVSYYSLTLGSASGALSAVDKVLAGLGLTVSPAEADQGITLAKKAEAFSAKISALIDGASKLSTGAGQLDAGIAELVTGAQTLDAGIGQVNTGAATLSAGTGALVANNDKLKNGAKELSDGAGQLNSGASQIKDGAKELNDGAGKLADGAGQVNNGANQLKNGAAQLSDGAGQLNNGANDLRNGAKDLNEGAGKLNDGIVELDDGVVELLDGVKKLDEEGIKKLYEAFDGDLTDFADRLTAIQEAGNNYTSFAGANEDENCSVKFIIKTEGVKAQDV